MNRNSFAAHLEDAKQRNFSLSLSISLSMMNKPMGFPYNTFIFRSIVRLIVRFETEPEAEAKSRRIVMKSISTVAFKPVSLRFGLDLDHKR